MANLSFTSRRSPVYSRHGSVACSQPLAAEIGVRILRNGGNAADAAVGVAAALNVTAPCSTGIGGDCFCLYYDAATKTVRGINGSGRSPGGLSLQVLARDGFTAAAPPPPRHAHHVTVPGAAAGWVDTVERYGSGKVSMMDILLPAIRLAEEGYPVAPVVAHGWRNGSDDLLAADNIHGRDLLLSGERAPLPGEVMRMPHLANTFRLLAENGKAGFYEGRIAESIVSCVQHHGGVLSMEDLKTHHSTFDTPIMTTYRGIDVWEMPPNGQGITALMALNILEGFDFTDIAHNSSRYLHALIEALQLSFADCCWYNADPNMVNVPVHDMLSKDYASQRRRLMKPDRCLPLIERGNPFSSTDTVYLSVTDTSGNACSFINSNYMGFGTALVPQGCGFTLHNRGANFSLEPDHPNVLAPGKRSYHTIIPGMATEASSGELFASFGVMGGYMQPQGHVQVLLNMIDYGMDPQAALDAPRFCIGPGMRSPSAASMILLEDGITDDTIAELKELGHNVSSSSPVAGHDRVVFGRGQIIQSKKGGVWCAGSDPRADGLAIGY